jgi:hypothetical protein
VSSSTTTSFGPGLFRSCLRTRLRVSAGANVVDSLRVNNVTGTFDLTVVNFANHAANTITDIGYNNVADMLPQFGRFDLGLEFCFWCTKKDNKDRKPLAGFSAKVVYARESTPDGKVNRDANGR